MMVWYCRERGSERERATKRMMVMLGCLAKGLAQCRSHLFSLSPTRSRTSFDHAPHSLSHSLVVEVAVEVEIEIKIEITNGFSGSSTRLSR